MLSPFASCWMFLASHKHFSKFLTLFTLVGDSDRVHSPSAFSPARSTLPSSLSLPSSLTHSVFSLSFSARKQKQNGWNSQYSRSFFVFTAFSIDLLEGVLKHAMNVEQYQNSDSFSSSQSLYSLLLMQRQVFLNQLQQGTLSVG